MNSSSITKRWIKTNLVFQIIAIIIAEIVVVLSIRNSYYSRAQNLILTRINTVNATLSASATLSDSERTQLIYRMSEEFSEKDKFEFMIIGTNSRVLATSSGFLPSDDMHLEDIRLAQQSEDGIATEIYRTKMGEKVLSATCIITPGNKTVYAVRLVTSMTKIDTQMELIISFALIILLVLVVFMIMSGTFFIRGIVKPIREIEATAAKISKGEFEIRINNNYHDEIGELCNAINNMAEDLGRSEEIKNEFISSVSHELRTPLTAIKGWAETMDGNPGDADTVKKGTGVILTETGRLYSMVENLLDFSRLQQRDMKLTKEKLDISAEVEDAVIMFAPRCKQNGIELEYDMPDDIIAVWGDRNRLRQVMVNLLDNAIKYTGVGGKISINIDYDKRKSLVTVSVTDNGTGIHPDDIEKVTQKFYKGKGSKRGSGIGLALVKEIINVHDGTFNVESEYGKYTKMTFTLPTIRTLRGK